MYWRVICRRTAVCVTLWASLIGVAWSETPDEAAVHAAIREGRYSDAVQRATALRAPVVPGSVSAPSWLLLESLLEDGRGVESNTRRLAERAVAALPAGSTDPAGRARAVGQLGVTEYQGGNYWSARDLLTQAQALRRALPAGSGGRLAVEELRYLALALIQASRNTDALAALNQALALAEALPADGPASVIRVLHVRIMVWHRIGDYPKGHVDAERAMQLEEARTSPHPDRALTLMHWGEQLEFEGHLEQAREALEHALSVIDATLREGHPDRAWVYRIAAIPAQELGDAARARALQERAASMAEASVGPMHPLTADCIQDLGATLFNQADFIAARALWERALRIYDQRLGPEYLDSATVLHNLAVLHARLGDFDGAMPLHRRAISKWVHAVGPSHAVVAVARDEFARTLAEQGRHLEAVAILDRVLVIRERALGPNHILVAQSLSSLARSLVATGQVKRALAVSRRAMGIWEASDAQSGPLYADSQLIHAAVLQATGDPAGALALLDVLTARETSALGSAHPEIARMELARATALSSLGRMAEAAAAALAAEEIGRAHAVLISTVLPERQALDYALTRPRGLGLVVSLLAAQDDPSLAFDAVIKGRALVLDEVVVRQRQARQQVRGTEAAWASLSAARLRLANLAMRGPGTRSDAEYAVAVTEARAARESAERAVAEVSPSFRADQRSAQVGLTVVREDVPAGTALVSFLRYDDIGSGRWRAPVPSYVAFVLRAGARVPAFVRLGRAAEIDGLIGRWRSAVQAEATPRDAAARDNALRAGMRLRQRLWDPLTPHLSGATRVYVVPDGAIGLVPPAALPAKGGGFLAEEGLVIHQLSAERDLDRLQQAPQLGHGLLALGGAAFSRAGGVPRQAPAVPLLASALARAVPSGALRSAASGCTPFGQVRFSLLPGSKDEVEAVGAVWRSSMYDPATSLFGAAATERAFKALASGRRVLHLSTHGFFLGRECEASPAGARSVGGLTGVMTGTGQNPRSGSVVPESPLLLSGLALAGANARRSSRDGEEDGILTAEEVASLDLEGVEWAVLSACDTGLGTLAAGEGVYGLRRAFQMAGVRTVIMSLWPVEDRSARDWMTALYAARFEQRLDTPDAVRYASLTVLRNRRAKGLSTSPFYWAAFVAAGDWR